VVRETALYRLFMTTYQVDSEAVLSATASIHASMERLSGESGALLGQLVNLQGSWSGAAASAFQSVVSDWRATQLRVEESLGSIGHALGAAAQQYAEAETTNARLFQR
jgi:WXG100 family type VII secretion target